MKKVVIYARHSKIYGAVKLLEKQIQKCTEYAAERGFEVLNIYSDLGLATDPRPGYDELLKDADGADWDFVLVAACNRLTVTYEQFDKDLAVLRDNDIRVLDISERCIIDLKLAKAVYDTYPMFGITGWEDKQ